MIANLQQLWCWISESANWLAPTIANAVLVFIGWRVLRANQRRQTAVSLMLSFRFQESWIRDSRILFDKFSDEPKYDWQRLAEKKANGDASPAELELYQAAITVLNFQELLAVSVLHGAADERIIKNMAAPNLETIFSRLRSLIEFRRKAHNDSRYWMNIEILAARWRKS